MFFEEPEPEVLNNNNNNNKQRTAQHWEFKPPFHQGYLHNKLE